MIPLHTRAHCDVCGDPATVEFEGGFFLCARCDTIKQREFPQSSFIGSELMCVGPSSIRVLDAGRGGRTDCELIDPIRRNPVDGADKAWSPGLRAVTGDNSELDIPPFLRRDQNNVPAFARAS